METRLKSGRSSSPNIQGNPGTTAVWNWARVTFELLRSIHVLECPSQSPGWIHLRTSGKTGKVSLDIPLKNSVLITNSCHTFQKILTHFLNFCALLCVGLLPHILNFGCDLTVCENVWSPMFFFQSTVYLIIPIQNHLNKLQQVF